MVEERDPAVEGGVEGAVGVGLIEAAEGVMHPYARREVSIPKTSRERICMGG